MTTPPEIEAMVLLRETLKHNPSPWEARKCGSAWDICLPSNPEDTGVGVVATVFCGEEVAQWIVETCNAARDTSQAKEIAALRSALEKIEQCATPLVEDTNQDRISDLDHVRSLARAALAAHQQK